MEYVPYVPSEPPLVGVVENMFSVSGYEPEHRLERLVPDGRIHLVIELDGRTRYVFDNETGEPRQPCKGAWLSGVHGNYITIGETRPASKLVAAQFAPGRARCLLPDDLDRYCDRVVPASEVFGPEIATLRDSLLANEAMAGLAALHTWLCDRHDPSREAPPVIRFVMKHLLATPGTVRFTDLVAEEGSVSYRRFLELFRRHVGPTPKRMQRILRFYQVFERLQSQSSVDWAGLSLELGYADQAHFIREFRAFSGYRPSEFAAQEHDRVNFFPDDDVE